MWIGDTVIGQSRWLVATRLKKILPWLDICGSVILLSIQVGELWQLAQEEELMTGNVWIVDPVWYLSRLLVATRQIGRPLTWNGCIDDLIIYPSRWLVATCQEKQPFSWNTRIHDPVINPSQWLVAICEGETTLGLKYMDRSSCYRFK